MIQEILIGFVVNPFMSQRSRTDSGKLNICPLIAMGLHKEPQDPTEVPFFLPKCRMKVFATDHRSHKSLCTCLGRLPRIPRLYYDVKIPLDISNETVMLDGPELEALSQPGCRWLESRHSHQACHFHALRYIMNFFWEEILKTTLGSRVWSTS